MNIVDVLRYGDRTVHQTLTGLPSDSWQTAGVCGYWSVKDIMAHLASYERVLTETLNDFLSGGETPTRQRMLTMGDGFNDFEVDAHKHLSSQEIMAEYQSAVASNLDLVARIPPEKLREAGALPWYGMEYSLEDYVVYAFYGHKREHSAQIAVFKDKFI
jgi:hypothetical protein